MSCIVHVSIFKNYHKYRIETLSFISNYIVYLHKNRLLLTGDQNKVDLAHENNIIIII